RRAASGKAFATDADAVADRLAVPDEQVEEAVARVDDDDARLVGNAGRNRHDLTEIFGFDAPDIDRRYDQGTVPHGTIQRRNRRIDRCGGLPVTAEPDRPPR